MNGELIKGDENNLEGRVIVILTTKNPVLSIGSFAESDIEIFCKLGRILCENGRFPEEYIKEMIKQYAAEEEAFKKFMAGELDLPLDQLLIPSYRIKFAISAQNADAKQIILNGERMISANQNIQSDVYVIKSIESESCLIQTMENAVNEYFMEFQRQMINHSSSPSKAYRDLIGKPIIQYVTMNYIIPMFAALETGDTKKFKEHKQGFMRFGRKTLIIHDIIELCNRIENYSSESNNSNIVDLLARRIEAVHTDDLMAATDYTKRLNELKGEANDTEVKRLLEGLNFSPR